MTAEVLSWIIPLVGALCFWLCIKHPWGWFVGIGQQVLYLWYAYATHNWGFILHSLIYTAIFIRNFRFDTNIRDVMSEAQLIVSLKKKKAKKTREEIAAFVKKLMNEGYDTVEINGHKIPKHEDG